MRLRERSSPSGRTCGEAVRWHWTCRRTFVRRNHCAVGLCPTDHDGPSPDSLEIERLSLVVTAAGADTCSVSGRLQLDVFSFRLRTVSSSEGLYSRLVRGHSPGSPGSCGTMSTTTEEGDPAYESTADELTTGGSATDESAAGRPATDGSEDSSDDSDRDGAVVNVNEPPRTVGRTDDESGDGSDDTGYNHSSGSSSGSGSSSSSSGSSCSSGSSSSGSSGSDSDGAGSVSDKEVAAPASDEEVAAPTSSSSSSSGSSSSSESDSDGADSESDEEVAAPTSRRSRARKRGRARARKRARRSSTGGP